MSEELKGRIISWLENARSTGAFDGHDEETMEFNQLDEKDLRYYLEDWMLPTLPSHYTDEEELLENEGKELYDIWKGLGFKL